MHDQSHAIQRSQDLEEANAILRELRGQECWRARLGYGDELRLDFGTDVPYRSALLADKQRGEWILGTRASRWTLQPPGQLEEIDPLSYLEGTTVLDGSILYPSLDLRLELRGGTVLEVAANAEELDLAAWELFVPSGMVLTLGPGRSWSYKHGEQLVD